MNAKNAALAALSTLFAILVAEGALRAAGFSYPNFWVPDPLTGSALRPGMEGWHQTEGRAHVRVNSRGLRDLEHALPKPPRTYRIAVLGDSYAEAIQVEREQTFWALLPGRLARCNFAGERRVEPVNFGVSGYGTALELITLRERVWPYEPDLVLLAFFPGNDVRNNSRRLEDEPGRPYFELRDGALHLDTAYRSDPEFVARQRTAAARAPLQKLRLYQLLRRVKAGQVTRGQHNAPIAAALAGGEPVSTLGEQGLDENAFRPPRDPAWREAWDLTDRLLLKVHEEVAARGIRFVLVVLSTPGTVYPDAEMRKRYAASLGVQTLFYPDERLQRLGRERGFEVVALGPPMQELADASNTYYHGFSNTRLGFGHWNPAGHAVAAELIAEALCAGRHDPERLLVHPERAVPASRVALPR